HHTLACRNLRRGPIRRRVAQRPGVGFRGSRRPDNGTGSRCAAAAARWPQRRGPPVHRKAGAVIRRACHPPRAAVRRRRHPRAAHGSRAQEFPGTVRELLGLHRPKRRAGLRAAAVAIRGRERTVTRQLSVGGSTQRAAARFWQNAWRRTYDPDRPPVQARTPGGTIGQIAQTAKRSAPEPPPPEIDVRVLSGAALLAVLTVGLAAGLLMPGTCQSRPVPFVAG